MVFHRRGICQAQDGTALGYRYSGDAASNCVRLYFCELPVA